MTHVRIPALLLVLAVLAAACGRGDDDDDVVIGGGGDGTTAATPTATATTGATATATSTASPTRTAAPTDLAPGLPTVISSADDAVVLVAPTDEIPEGEAVTIEAYLDGAQWPQELIGVFAIGRVYEIGPTDLALAGPVTLSVRLDAQFLSGDTEGFGANVYLFLLRRRRVESARGSRVGGQSQRPGAHRDHRAPRGARRRVRRLASRGRRPAEHAPRAARRLAAPPPGGVRPLIAARGRGVLILECLVGA